MIIFRTTGLLTSLRTESAASIKFTSYGTMCERVCRKVAAKITQSGPDLTGSMIFLNFSQIRLKGDDPARSETVMSPRPHMSLHIIRLPVVRVVEQRGSLVSILVVARMSAGRSPSQYPSPTCMMLAILTSPCAIPHACMLRKALSASVTTRTGTPAGAPLFQLSLDIEARSLVPRSKTVHSSLTLRVSLGSPPAPFTPWAPAPSTPHRRSASSLPRTRRVRSLGVIVAFSVSGITGISTRCQNQRRGESIRASGLSLSSTDITSPPRCPAGRLRSLLRCLTTCREKACSVGSW
mmetsp:Transcript_18147/g.43786  ORF Transcript_18147/g.43786 Transcript_18147/m.43786 type:complete len:294 (+) Transcript_18147:551-1432(+)